VLITSRREEHWLDCGYTLVDLRGLREQDVEELAAKILETAGVDRKNLPAEYLELLKLLGGHPLSLRVVLPHLKMQSPGQLIEALRQGLDTFQGAEEEGRDKSLTVSLDYSFAKLSERARRHLPFLGLFCERVDVALLSLFSESLDAYQAVFDNNFQGADWLQILKEAVEAGVLEHIDETTYHIHPALPWYLRQRLSQCYTTQDLIELEKKLLIYYTYFADNCREVLTNEAELAMSELHREEPNLLQNLRLAEQQQEWAMAQAILQPLGVMYERTGRKPEFKSLRLRALQQIGTNLTAAKAKGKEAFGFWEYLRNQDANEAAQDGNFEEAKKIYKEILDELTALNDPSVNDKTAIFYNLLGNIAWEQRQFNNAITYYQQALHIFEAAGNDYSAATVYFQLGNVAGGQQSFKQAIAYYRKALQIFEAVGDFYKAASCYSNLGILAQQKQQFDNARDYYRQAIQIYEEIGDEYSTAGSYHNLGVIAEAEGKIEDAINFYYKSLQIKETAGNYYRAGSDYHCLGNIAVTQRQFDEAIAYYQKALQVYEAAGDEYNLTDVYLQLGTTAQEQQQFDEAIAYYQKAFVGYRTFQEWYKASITLVKWGNVLEAQEKWAEALQIYTEFVIDVEHGHELIDLRIRAWSRILNHLGANQFDAIWHEATGEECPEQLRSLIQAASEENEE
jgi:tetratricopeptide (TPR) repeat protein